MRTILIVVLAGLLAACGGASGASESAGDAIKRQLEFLGKGQFGRQWDELHPAQQQVVTRDAFLRCASTDALFEIRDVRVLETYDESIPVATLGEIDSTAVTVRFLLDGEETTHTFHAVLVDTDWRWVLIDDAVEAYAAGECP